MWIYFANSYEYTANFLYQSMFVKLSHWGRETHICVGKLTIIASDNGLSPGRRQAIISTNAGILLTGPLITNCNGILIEIHTFSFKKMHLKMSSAKWRPCCLGLNVLTAWPNIKFRLLVNLSHISDHRDNKPDSLKPGHRTAALCRGYTTTLINVSDCHVTVEMQQLPWPLLYFVFLVFTLFNWLVWCIYPQSSVVYSISQEICTRFCCALLCCGYAIVHNEFTWSIYPYSSGLLCWHWGNR